MSEKEQYKKVKLYRTLKVVFYCLGLPLFFLLVMATASRFAGHDPFIGEMSGDLLVRFKGFMSGSALNGVWIAAAIWGFIAIVQIIVHYTVKNGRTKTMIVVAVTLVAMLGSMLVMDSIFNAKINEIAASAPAGVTVSDYKTQLSYLDMRTGGTDGKDLTLSLIEDVAAVKRAYNVAWQGEDLSGTANNIGNNAVYYDTIISDDGRVGVDIGFNADGTLNLSGDGNPDNDHILVRLAPTGAEYENGSVVMATGYLEINGEKYSHYWCMPRFAGDKQIYVWYTKDMMSTEMVGEYGYALYNQNNMLSDGWVFSVENTLKILEAYYGSQEALNAMLKAGIPDGDGNYYTDFDTMHQTVIAEAQTRMDDYYAYEADPWLGALYSQEVNLGANFSLTQGELVKLVAELGRVLGDNALFDYIFDSTTTVGEILAPTLSKLKQGITLKGLLTIIKGLAADLDVDSINNTVVDVFKSIFKDETITDLCINVVYQDNDVTGTNRTGAYIAIFKCTADEDGTITSTITSDDKLIDINLDDTMDLDTISLLLNTVIDNMGISGTINTVIGLVNTVGGLIGLDLQIILNLFDSTGHVVDLTAFLADLLTTYYSYQSPIFSIYNFYGDPDYGPTETLRQAQEYFAAYDRAYYTGSTYGTMIGSTLIGDSIGDGSYPSALGLTSLAAVQQLLIDLSYKADYYPIFALRELLMSLTAAVVMFTFFSYLCAIKEKEWATGKATVAEKRVRKKKGKKYVPTQDAQPDILVPVEDTALNVGENTDKEVGLL